MKRKVQNAASAIAFMIVLALMVNYVTEILSRKDSIIKYHDLKEEEQQIDVMFFGSSHMINGIYPMELWNEYGIASYNCGGHGNQIPTTYWVMKNVLDNSNPRLAVIDILGVGWNGKIRSGRTGIDQQHISFDWVNLSRNKFSMVNYLFDDMETRAEFIFPISIYHDRWSELKQSDFEVKYSSEKGAEYRANRAAPDDFFLIDRNEWEIPVLLVNIPYPMDEESQKWGNGVDLIAGQYGVNYLNFQYENTGVDFFTDMYDTNSHLNPSGARKLTSYIGQYIMEHYEIPNRSQDTAYDGWNDAYKEYSLYKWDILRGKKDDLWTYLSLLADDSLNICLFFNGESEMIYWGTPPRLVMNLAELGKFQRASDERKDYFMIVDRVRDEVIEFIDSEYAHGQSTSFGKINYTRRDENGMRGLYINGGDTNYLLNGNGTLAEIAIVCFDKNTGELVDSVKFNRNVSVNVLAE